MRRVIVIAGGIALVFVAAFPVGADDGLRSGETSSGDGSSPSLEVAAKQSAPECQETRPGTLAPPWHMAGQAKRARIYIDVSGSMKSYQRSTGSLLYQVLDRLKGFLFEAGVVEPLEGAGFGVATGKMMPLPGLVSVLEWEMKEQNTCLVAPIQAEIAAEKPAVMVLITDGIASAQHSACGDLCTSGSDVTCVAQALVPFLIGPPSRGLWVVGLRVPFNGRYDPESCPGTKIEPKKSKPNKAGVDRPIYLWIGSDDLEAGRMVVSRLVEWGRSQPADVLAMEVWPGIWSGLRAGTPNTGTWKTSDFADQGALKASCKPEIVLAALGDKSAVPPSVLLKRKDPKGARLALRIPGVQLEERLIGSAALLHVQLKAPIRIEGGHDLGTLGAKLKQSEAALETCVEVEKPDMSAGDREEVRFRARWQAIIDTAPLDSWSTDNDCKDEALGRTLNLDTLWRLVGGQLADRVSQELETTLLCAGIH